MKSLELIRKDGKIVKVTIWGTNDLFDNDRNGKYGPVYFVDTLNIIKQNRDSLLCFLDAKNITFFRDSVPTNIHTTKEAIKYGIPVIPPKYAFLWIDSTTSFCIINKDDDTLHVDCKYYDKSKYIKVR